MPVKAELIVTMNILIAGNNTEVINDINMNRIKLGNNYKENFFKKASQNS